MPRQLQTTAATSTSTAAAAAAATATTMTTTCGCDATWNLSQVKSIKCKIAVLRWLLLNLHIANSSSSRIRDDSNSHNNNNNNNSNSCCCCCNCCRKTSSQRFQLIWLSFKAYQSSKLQIHKLHTSTRTRIRHGNGSSNFANHTIYITSAPVCLAVHTAYRSLLAHQHILASSVALVIVPGTIETTCDTMWHHVLILHAG